MEINAQARKIVGKQVKALRREGQVPAVIFGLGKASTPIAVNAKEFAKAFAQAGEATLIDLKIAADQPRKVLVTGIQRDPVSREMLHVDFQEVSLTEKITTAVPLKVVGESPLLKTGGAILLNLVDELEVTCFPTDLPPEISVDISGLTGVGQGVAIKDLAIDRSKIEVKEDPETLVVKLDFAQMAEEKEEEVSEEEAVGKVEATAEKPEEEEAVAEPGGKEGKEKVEKAAPAEKEKPPKEETPKKK